MLAVALMKISCAKSSDNVCTNSARLLDDAHSRRRTKVYSVLGKIQKDWGHLEIQTESQTDKDKDGDRDRQTDALQCD